MSTLSIHKKEIIEYKKLQIIGELLPIKEHIKIYENKYQCSFRDFEKKIRNEQENYENWDTYIEWKAYQKKLEHLEKCIPASCPY